MPIADSIVNLPGYKVKKISGIDRLLINLDYVSVVSCPFCNSQKLRKKAKYVRKVRHESIGVRSSYLLINAHKYYCKDCLRYFNQRFPGICLRRRNSERFREEIFEKHKDGVCQKILSKKYTIGTATIERWYHDFLYLKNQESKDAWCPKIMGIDEHSFSKKQGYVTTICNLSKQKVFDVILGRSHSSLEPKLNKLLGKENVKIVVMDLAETYRNLVKKEFPNALIVADRFHVIRLINHHFIKTWGLLDPLGRKSRGLLSLMRRHPEKLKAEQKIMLNNYFKNFPAIKIVYDFKQNITKLLLMKRRNKQQCKYLVPKFLAYINQLKEAVFEPLVTLGNTLESWKEEIARMWRFTKSNGITEGFHNKMKTIQKIAYGFKNFENYRLRVKALCC